MKDPHQRILQLESLLRAEISKIFFKKIKDPRIARITITNVVLSNDLRIAKVFFRLFRINNSFTIPENIEDIIESVNKAAGFIRYQLKKRLHLKIIPSLKFFFDDSVEYAEMIENKLRQIKGAK